MRSHSRQILTRAGRSLPFQTLSVRKRDDVSVGVHTASGAAAPHALHAVAGAVGARGPQRARFFAWPRILIRTNWNKSTNVTVLFGTAF